MSERRIGILAGWGRFPVIVAETLRRQGYSVYGLGVKDHADGGLRELCDVYREIGVGRLGAAIRFFKRHEVKQATMAGKFHKVILFQKCTVLKHLPDWRGLRTYYPMIVKPPKDRTDDTLLTAVVAAFAEDGIHFAPATDFAPELLVKFGILNGRALGPRQQKDILFGWRLAKEMGRLDVGQSVAVKGQAVLAVEAVEGTDACIRRAGQLCPAGGFTIVKVAKPQQDMRFDVPTIGLGTVQTLVECGAAVLAVEADKTIILDEQEVIDFARRHGLTVVATHPDRADEMLDAA